MAPVHNIVHVTMGAGVKAAPGRCPCLHQLLVVSVDSVSTQNGYDMWLQQAAAAAK